MLGGTYASCPVALVITTRVLAISIRRAGVGLGRPHLRCHEEDAQQTARESDRGGAGMSRGRRAPRDEDHHAHGNLAAHLHLVVVSIFVKYPRSRGAALHTT
jgi:hypothetical protein